MIQPDPRKEEDEDNVLISDEAAALEQRLKNIVEDLCSSEENISLEKGWGLLNDHGVMVLQRALVGIISGNRNTDSRPFGVAGHSCLYTISFRMCSHAGQDDHSIALYHKHGDAIKDFLQAQLVPRIKNLVDNRAVLRDFAEVWRSHKLLTKWMHRLFMHLDRGVVSTDRLPSLTAASLNVFYTHLFQNVKDRVVQAVLDFIALERQGEDVDRQAIRECAQTFEIMGMASAVKDVRSIAAALKLPTDLAIYKKELEAPYVEASRIYYRQVSTEWISNCDIPTYLELAEQHMLQEFARVRQFLHTSTIGEVEKAFLESVVVAQRDHLVGAVTDILHDCYAITEGDSGDVEMPIEQRETLRRMFDLFRRTREISPDDELFNLMECMADGFRKYVREVGAQAVRSAHAEASEAAEAKDGGKAKSEASKNKVKSDTASKVVDKLIVLHARMSKAVDSIFDNSPRFQRALADAFGDLSNQDVDDETLSVTRLLPVHCDRLLRKGGARISESEAEAALEHCIKLFTYLSDKDMFAEVYRDLLAARLLNDRSISDALERSFVGKLKAHCGGSFTAKLEGMLNDFLIRADYQQEFKEPFEEWQTGQEDEAVRKIEFVPQLLTVSNWPSQKARRVELPDAMASIVTFFNSWYQEKHNNSRKLQWLHTLGDVTVSAVYGGSPRPKKYDVVLAPIQAAVLLLFHNTVDPMTVEDLIVRSGMQQDEEAAKRILHSLFSQPKTRLLLKDPAPMPVRRTDLIRVNTEFKSKVRKFRVGMPVLDAQRNVKRDVDALRSIRIDACIVRTMKARKTLAHTDLVGEVLHQLHTFKPGSRAVKRAIETLIEREYLERDPSNPQQYRYVA